VGLALALSGDVRAKEKAWEKVGPLIRAINRENQKREFSRQENSQAKFECFVELARAQWKARDIGSFYQSLENAKVCLRDIERNWGTFLGVVKDSRYWVNYRLTGNCTLAGLCWKVDRKNDAADCLKNALDETIYWNADRCFNGDESARPSLTRYALVEMALAAERPDRAHAWMTYVGTVVGFNTRIPFRPVSEPDFPRDRPQFLLHGHRVAACCKMLREETVQSDKALLARYLNWVEADLNRFENYSTFNFLTDLGVAQVVLGRTDAASLQLDSLLKMPLRNDGYVRESNKLNADAEIQGAIALRHARSGHFAGAYNVLVKGGDHRYVRGKYFSLGKMVGKSDKADLADALVWIVSIQQGNRALGASALAGVAQGLAEKTRR
jgi:hypothetical protein